jgi:formylglycine-generating enzyme required for sulfatase activity
MKLVLIPPGEYEMGSTPEEVARELEEGKIHKMPQWYFDRIPPEAPRHHVRITKPFYLGMYPVTQAEYEKVMGVNPSATKLAGKDTSRHPVERLNWDEAMEFCHKLSTMPSEQAAAHSYRLPTEAQWEYACRAGTTTRWYTGDDEAEVMDAAWFYTNAQGMEHPVGEKKPNAWGLYDMHGNVWQWCQDWYDKDYYVKSPADDPAGPPDGSERVRRGGGWDGMAGIGRSACRFSREPAGKISGLSFRPSLVLADTAGERAKMSRSRCRTIVCQLDRQQATARLPNP